ncbi:hypothetical protein K431DRAFT_301864 [Polychaeton citri CBS 116435]|uniref:Uncharacterized protein n=1 Tax=Polychaeton citri CBS 116435 TaxID=1314669 RepID=A0A9P4QE71_9PEZI|nr:hypothetical protein K431DRAFT_301864 [Polychaeton citri CBS 116435]
MNPVGKSSKQRAPNNAEIGQSGSRPVGRICCDCKQLPPAFVCARCDRIQHTKCALSQLVALEQKKDLCNNCWENNLAQVKDNLQREVAKIERHSNALREKAKRNIAVEGGLWRHYCQLPKENATDALVQITKMGWKDDAYQPEHEAPEEWLEELQERLEKTLLHPSNEPRFDGLFPAEAESIKDVFTLLSLWRKEAVFQLHHGLLKGKKEQLGLLAELFGLDPVGTYWKGPPNLPITTT